MHDRKWPRIIVLFSIFIPLVALPAAGQTAACPQTAALSQYEGRYRMPDGSVLIVREVDGELTLRPIFWRSVQPLRQKSGDAFGIEQREDRQVEFMRNAGGCVTAVKIAGFGDDGTFPRLGNEKVPVETLLEGQPEIAARLMIKADKNGVKKFVGIGETLLRRFPSQAPIAVRFFKELAARYPQDAGVYSAIGAAYVAIGNRMLALESYKRANELDPANTDARVGLRRLKVLEPSAEEISRGWKLPFPLEALFAKPSAAEIKEAENDWAKRNLSAKNARVVKTGSIDLGHVKAQVRIVSHSVHGFKHYGAIIVPEGLTTGKHPVVLDLKGVSWDYFPLNLNNLISPAFLGPDQGKFIYVVPSFRGEVMKFDGAEYRSEGDRTDSWDGATDDALALLNAALKITPQADPARICAFGKSRGGSVALLAGIRDKRITRVLGWAGPADWFALMGSGGWTQEEIIREALLKKPRPNEEGGQFIERFLLKAVEGKWKLKDVRRKMVQDSPVYFAEGLPLTQAHYGIEDEIVPVANGRALSARITIAGKVKGEFFYHDNAGHDLNQKIAFRESKKFVMEMIGP